MARTEPDPLDVRDSRGRAYVPCWTGFECEGPPKWWRWFVLIVGVGLAIAAGAWDFGENGSSRSHVVIKIVVVMWVLASFSPPMLRPERSRARDFLRGRACPGCGTRMQREAGPGGLVECAECGLAWAEAHMPPLPPAWTESRRGDLEEIQRPVLVDEVWPCPTCRYDLRGLKPDEKGRVRCAECGHLCTPGELASMKPRRWRRLKPVRLDEWYSLQGRGPVLNDSRGKKGRLITPAHLAWLANAAQSAVRWKRLHDARAESLAVGRWKRLSGIAGIYAGCVLVIYVCMPWLAPAEFDTQYPIMPGRRFVQSLVLATLPTGILAGLFAVVLTRGDRIAFRPTEMARDMLIARGICPHCGGDLAGGDVLECGHCAATWEAPRKRDAEGSTD